MISYTSPILHAPNRWAGKRIGLFGGSFNPPHSGHLHVAKTALHTLQLDFVWWLVTPQNPLKPNAPADIKQRIQACQELAAHPHMLVSDIESALHTHNTYQSVTALKKHFPKTDFVWISGMDSAHNLHKWNNWTQLLAEIAFFHVTRPPAQSLVQRCPLRLYAKQKHITLTKAAAYDLTPGRTYWMMNKKMNTQSSTALRGEKLP